MASAVGAVSHVTSGADGICLMVGAAVKVDRSVNCEKLFFSLYGLVAAAVWCGAAITSPFNASKSER